MWPSGVTFNKLVSSSCRKYATIKNKPRQLTYNYPGNLNLFKPNLQCCSFYLWDGVYGPWRQYMISQWSAIAGRQAQENTLIVTLKENKCQLTSSKEMFSNSCPNTHTLLTISWHHTQRLPAKVLIFLWQTRHFVDLSAFIQS